MKIAVLGAGAWGTALAINLSGRHDVSLWARDAAQLRGMAADRVNERYLPGCRFPERLSVEPDLPRALAACDYAVLAVTVSGLRVTLRRLRELRIAAPVIWLCKGFERPDARLPHEVYAEEMGGSPAGAVLSGPSFAQEVAAGLPAALTLAATDAGFAAAAAQALHGPALRVYSHDDVTGVEVGGAVKNVLAIACGVADGLGFGANARAAIITRGLAEMVRLGVAAGGRLDTFMGLAGVGDLVLTCTDDQSRNRRFGLLLAGGAAPEEALGRIGQVVEGYPAARAVRAVAQREGVSMPIVEGIHRTLYDGVPAADVVRELMTRPVRAETDGARSA
ncbi:MAG: NAD(P)-dependent glycerol-3-phosphate dehydrogenase [Burkholderiales bacterium]|nr:NAD(P)-dependent glycerol-3-phosphate dehydrogenase [Burkholderiales bacterium]